MTRRVTKATVPKRPKKPATGWTGKKLKVSSIQRGYLERAYRKQIPEELLERLITRYEKEIIAEYARSGVMGGSREALHEEVLLRVATALENLRSGNG
jgi:hypothetical protein